MKKINNNEPSFPYVALEKHEYKHYELVGLTTLFPFILLCNEKKTIAETKKKSYEADKYDEGDYWLSFAGVSVLEDAERIYEANKNRYDFLLLDNSKGITYTFIKKEEERNDN